MTIYRPKASKYFHSEFWVDGIRYRQSTKETSRVRALAAQEKKRAEVLAHRNGVPLQEKPRKFKEAAEDFLEVKRGTRSLNTYKYYKQNVVRLISFFGNRPLYDIAWQDVKRYQDQMLGKGHEPRGVNHDIATFRAIMRRNRAWERLRPDVRLLQEPDDYGIALERKPEKDLYGECKNSWSRQLYPFIITIRGTAMRHSEGLGLKCKQVDFRNRVIIVGDSKTPAGRHRRIPMNKTVLRALEQWKAQHPSWQPEHYVFFTERYKKARDSHDIIPFAQDVTKPRGPFKICWINARARAKVNVRVHDLRHTAVTRALNKTKDLGLVGRLVGWSPSTMHLMERRYRHLIDRNFKTAVNALDVGGL